MLGIISLSSVFTGTDDLGGIIRQLCGVELILSFVSLFSSAEVYIQRLGLLSQL